MEVSWGKPVLRCVVLQPSHLWSSDRSMLWLMHASSLSIFSPSLMSACRPCPLPDMPTDVESRFSPLHGLCSTVSATRATDAHARALEEELWRNLALQLREAHHLDSQSLFPAGDESGAAAAAAVGGYEDDALEAALREYSAAVDAMAKGQTGSTSAAAVSSAESEATDAVGYEA